MNYINFTWDENKNKSKKQITIRIEKETIDYFKDLANETDIPYQKLMNLFLRDCAQKQMKPSISWHE